MARLSVIIPVHNGQRFIGDAADRAPDQTHCGDLEVVAHDGARHGRAAGSVASFDPTARLVCVADDYPS